MQMQNQFEASEAANTMRSTKKGKKKKKKSSKPKKQGGQEVEMENTTAMPGVPEEPAGANEDEY